jgi:hypothetical protein
MELSERERAMLEIERSWWTEPGPKEAVIVDQLELSATRYFELLNQLIDRPEAELHDQLTVRRLRRMRDRRRQDRRSKQDRRNNMAPVNEEQSR